MKRATGLFDRAASFLALCRAARRAARGKKAQRSVARFLFHLEREALALERELREDRFRPGPLRTFTIRDPKPRLICAAPFRDRVVHHAVCAELEPVLERYSVFHSYACRPGKGQLRALDVAQRLCRRHTRFLKLDVSRYFASVDHAILSTRLGRLIKDPDMLRLLGRIIDNPTPGCPPGQGLPIGNLTSQHFANLYLGPLDHHVTERLRVAGYLRYMDDMLVFGDDRAALRRVHAEVRQFLAHSLGLQLKERATVCAPVTEGVPFLGQRVFPALRRLQAGAGRRARRGLLAAQRAHARGELSDDDLRRSLTGRLGHLRQCDTLELRRRWFAPSPGGPET